MTPRKISRAAVFLALLALTSGLSLRLGPVSLSLQTIFVFLAGMVLGPGLGPLTLLAYVLGGLLGLPFFAGWQGGLHYLVRPSFGFLLGFIGAAGLVGRGYQSPGKRGHLASLALANLWIYCWGLAYFYGLERFYLGEGTSLWASFQLVVLPFLPLDLVKTWLAYGLGQGLDRLGIKEKI